MKVLTIILAVLVLLTAVAAGIFGIWLSEATTYGQTALWSILLITCLYLSVELGSGLGACIAYWVK